MSTPTNPKIEILLSGLLSELRVVLSNIHLHDVMCIDLTVQKRSGRESFLYRIPIDQSGCLPTTSVSILPSLDFGMLLKAGYSESIAMQIMTLWKSLTYQKGIEAQSSLDPSQPS